MNQRFIVARSLYLSIALILITFVMGACTASGLPSTGANGNAIEGHAHDEPGRQLTAADLSEGERLQVVATTSIIADVVGQVGGDQIALSALFPTGADAHSYEPTPQDLVRMSDADVLFVNGLGLEAALDAVLTSLDGVPVVSVNTGVETAELGDDHDHGDVDHGDNDHGDNDHGDVDPHTWFSVHAVEQWTAVIAQTLSDLDPANAEIYDTNAAAYRNELAALKTELDGLTASLPADRRMLVTDHESLGYLAAEYDFEIIGAVIPSLSSMASTSARELAALQAQIVETGVPAIFVGVGANPTVAEQIAQDSGIEVVPIYVGTLSEADGPASTYLDFMRHTVRQIVEALQ